MIVWINIDCFTDKDRNTKFDFLFRKLRILFEKKFPIQIIENSFQFLFDLFHVIVWYWTKKQ